MGTEEEEEEEEEEKEEEEEGGEECENLISPKRNIFLVVQKIGIPLLGSEKRWTADWKELKFFNNFLKPPNMNVNLTVTSKLHTPCSAEMKAKCK
jgi:hypothetical protein